ncbi:MAG: glycosyltransferase family 2 protein [Acidobacteriota bacterium]
MRIAVVLVHYWTPGLAVAAVEALRRDAHASGIEIQGILIDNGNDDSGRELLRGIGFEYVDPGGNLGFAGGVNVGVAQTQAPVVLAMNPDVHVLPGCLGGLIRELNGGAEIAGPRFYWDTACRTLLPPTEERDRRAEILARLAVRGEGWALRARRHWRRHARRHWDARDPLPSYSLSGGLLAFTRRAWTRVGPFDEGFRLYFEETDWLLRAARLGLAARYVPGAGAIHLHGRSAVQEPRSADWFADSAWRFRKLHHGRRFSDFLGWLETRQHGPALAAPDPIPERGLELARFSFPLWLEVSPNETGYPAAAERLTAAPPAPWEFSPEVLARVGDTRLDLRLVSERGRELAWYSLTRSPRRSDMIS